MVLPVVGRWVHVGAAIVVVGGLFFLRLVLMPSAAQALGEEAQQALRERVMGRWKKIVHLCVGLLLISGGYNFYRSATVLHPGQPLYHALAGIKIMTAMLVFTLSIGLTGRSQAFAPLRRNPRVWLAVTLALAGVIVLISGVLRNIPIAGS